MGVKFRLWNLGEQWRQLCCLVPVSTVAAGNVTEVWLEGGERITEPRRVKTVLKGLARHFAVDLGACRDKYGAIDGHKRTVPLVLHPDLVLIAVKSRVPATKDEGAAAYVVLDKVAECQPSEGGEWERGTRSQLLFRDGSVLQCLYSLNTLRSRLNGAEAARRQYLSLHLPLAREVEPERSPRRTFYLRGRGAGAGASETGAGGAGWPIVVRQLGSKPSGGSRHGVLRVAERPLASKFRSGG